VPRRALVHARITSPHPKTLADDDPKPRLRRFLAFSPLIRSSSEEPLRRATSVSGTGGPFSSTKPSRVPKNPRRPRRPSRTFPRPPRCARSSSRYSEEHLDDLPAPFGTVQPRARKPRREHPEGPSRPTPEPDRPEAPRQLTGSSTAPRRALRCKNR
jgi:hypothetical protein